MQSLLAVVSFGFGNVRETVIFYPVKSDRVPGTFFTRPRQQVALLNFRLIRSSAGGLPAFGSTRVAQRESPVDVTRVGGGEEGNRK